VQVGAEDTGVVGGVADEGGEATGEDVFLVAGSKQFPIAVSGRWIGMSITAMSVRRLSVSVAAALSGS
jgi:hypothetical protein